MNSRSSQIAVVVPTYWTRAGGAPKRGDAVYDHPTPLDEEGTLGRLLDSLKILDGDFYVVVVVAVTAPEVAAEASPKIGRLTQERPELDIVIVDDSHVRRLEEALPACRNSALIGLEDYSRVRNLQLLVPVALGCSAIVAVDDDEVVVDPAFLSRATEGLESTIDNKTVAGLAGYYLQNREGEIMLSVPPGAESAVNIFDRKAILMNDATRQLEALPGRIVPTPFCFGGNMTFSPKLAATVAFDPGITRGEDIDYLINARLDGQWFFLNKNCSILHLPPPGGSYKDQAFHKTVQDVLRFIYERAKLRAWKEIGATAEVTAAELDPYPGLFLQDDLDGYAKELIQRVIEATSPEQRTVLGLADSAHEFLQISEQRAQAAVKQCRSHQNQWKQLVAAVQEHPDAVELFEDHSQVDA